MSTLLAMAESSGVWVSLSCTEEKPKLEKTSGEGYRLREIHFGAEVGVLPVELQKALGAPPEGE